MSLIGLRTGLTGSVQNPVQLTQTIVDGLAVYNQTADPLISVLAEPVYSTQARVHQAPIGFERVAEGVNPDNRRVAPRELLFPLGQDETIAAFTRLGYEDSLVEDIVNTVNAAVAGYEELRKGRLFAQMFRSRTAGSIGTAYRASFANGESDLPSHGNGFTTGTAHSHYAGLNSTTLTIGQIVDAVEDIAQHGYQGQFIGLFSLAQFSDLVAIADSNVRGITPARAQLIDNGIIGEGVMIGGVTCYIDNYVPSGYFGVLSVAVPPMGDRQHDKPEYRGLMVERGTDPDNPLIGMRFRSRTDFACRHLAAGAFRQLVASTTYTNPTMRFQD